MPIPTMDPHNGNILNYNNNLVGTLHSIIENWCIESNIHKKPHPKFDRKGNTWNIYSSWVLCNFLSKDNDDPSSWHTCCKHCSDVSVEVWCRYTFCTSGSLRMNPHSYQYQQDIWQSEALEEVHHHLNNFYFCSSMIVSCL